MSTQTVGHSALDGAPRRQRLSRIALAVGFWALAAAAVVSVRSPARNYEASIYGSTPVAFWVAIGIVLAVSIVVGFGANAGRTRTLAALLGGCGVVAVAGLPLLRGYYFFGASDAMTHLGWVRDIGAGELSAFDLFYPATHLLTLAVAETAGLPTTTAMLLVVLLSIVSFLLFVPLTVRELAGGEDALVVGALAAFMVFPINQIAVHYMSPHPISSTILLSPVVLYLLARYLRVPTTRDGTGVAVSGVGLLLGVSAVGTVLYHSEQTANVLVLFAVVCAVQFAYRRWRPGHPIARHRTLYVQTALLALAFVLWNTQHGVVDATVQATGRELLGAFGGRSQVGSVVAQRSSSLGAVGAGLVEIFAKLFLAGVLFAIPAIYEGLASLSDGGDPSLARSKYFALGAATVGIGSLLLFVGNVSRLFFRHLGFVMTLVTILGAVALVRWLGGLSPDYRAAGEGVLAALLALALVSSLLVMFPSPYIYQPNGQVSAETMSGYETAFAEQDPEVMYAGIRSGPQRYVQGVYGRENVPPGKDRFFYRQHGRTPPSALANLPAHFTDSRYLVVTQRDRVRELEAYDGIDYTRTQLDSVRGQVGVSRVHSNGAFTLYYVPNASSERTSAAVDDGPNAGA